MNKPTPMMGPNTAANTIMKNDLATITRPRNQTYTLSEEGPLLLGRLQYTSYEVISHAAATKVTRFCLARANVIQGCCFEKKNSL